MRYLSLAFWALLLTLFIFAGALMIFIEFLIPWLIAMIVFVLASVHRLLYKLLS